MSRDTASLGYSSTSTAAAGGAGASANAGAGTMASVTAPATTQTIPNRIHFIWLGTSTLPVRYLWNILNCHELNAHHYSVHLWVNPEYFDDRTKTEYKRFNFLEMQGVKLRNYHELATKTCDEKTPDKKNLDDESIIFYCINKTHLTRPVVASDILRVRILADKEEGGFYFDTDTIFKKALPPSISCLTDTGLIIDETIRGYLIAEKDNYLLNNSFMASMADGREIKMVMQILVSNLKSLLGYGESMMEAMPSEMVVRYTGLQLFSTLCRLPRLDGTGPHCQRDFSRLNYAGKLSHLKAHSYDNTWMDTPPIARNRHHDWLASVALFMRSKGKLDRNKLSQHIVTGDCDEKADRKGPERPTSCLCTLIKK